MRYFYEKPKVYLSSYGRIYSCNHAVYSRCTLFEINGRGLAVIQQRYDTETKCTSWGETDPWLAGDIYTNPNFIRFFEEYSGIDIDGIYPTVTVRQIMWALKMKPLRREIWETGFDRKII